MEKVIRYNGHTAQPSDYETPDGDLALSLGVVHEDESLRNALPPAELFNVPDGYKVAYIHKTSAFTHYILLKYATDTWTAYWVDNAVVEAEAHPPHTFEAGEIHLIDGYSYSGSDQPKVVGIGNTLVIYDGDGMTYVLWKSTTYKYLGTHLPEINLKVGLLGHPRFYSLEYNGAYQITFDAISHTDFQNGAAFTDSNKTKVTEQVMSKLNKFIADTSVNDGKHCFPFFVRYALRLYDGSLTMPSAPILMNPCTHSGPTVYVKTYSVQDNEVKKCTIDMMLMACQLTYQACENYGYSGQEIDTWKDIVKSVEIFVSKPIYTYNQDGYIDSFHDSDNLQTKFIGKLYSEMEVFGTMTKCATDTPTKDVAVGPIEGGYAAANVANLVDYYTEWKYEQIISIYNPRNADRDVPEYTLHLPERESSEMIETLENESSFYLLHSIPFEDIGNSYLDEVVIETPNDYLQSLLQRETLPDDYLSHDALIPGSSFVYNSRLNLSSLDRVLFNGFPAPSVWARCGRDHKFVLGNIGSSGYKEVSDIGIAGTSSTYEIYVFINDDNGEHVVKSYDSHNSISPFFSYSTYNHSSHCWFFYPNPNAYKAVVFDNYQYYTINLKQHPMLNGAYAMLEYDATRNAVSGSAPDVTNTHTIVPNKIYTSEVNNPFFFPLLGINTVGTGQILGLASATKALSQGQFGQFPLYAFTTDGVWALEVSSTGSYSAKQPVTRDVCISMESITQLDSSVVFATDRGLMMLQGSDAICISDDIREEDGEDYATAYRGLQYVCDSSFVDALSIVPLREFIANCRLMYDYTNQHIFVFNPDKTYAYVFSLKSKKWGMIRSNLKNALNSYPESICVVEGDENDVVVDYGKTSVEPDTQMPFVVLTRPLKLDAPDIMKTIDTIIQRGKFQRGHVKTLLYGSRDLYHWFLVYTSVDHYLRGFRGTPYKYFRIALVGATTKDERIFGCEINFTPRLVDQLR